MNTEPMFSSKTCEWATPQEFFDQLNETFRFNLDPCATEENAKCRKFFTAADDGLKQSWGGVPRILQSSLRERDRRVGAKGIRGEQEAWNDGCYAAAGAY